MFEHYVVFKPKPGRAGELTQALQEFGDGVRETLPCLTELTFGENLNKSGLDRGFTHGCLARLASEAAFKDDYWNHPAHVRLIAALDELCEERFALDYVPKEAVTGRGGTT
ncbi:Stress responsive A/B Barrel Domain [Mycobacteroides abscessus subsp. bolletii]|uniref:Dabb family protein n=1 Tax=Mycobacteroides abscessus TaxID=36809 RepID=UPI0009A8B5FB|nr:Dabb family protein [Mycobacteroides abscessus]SKG68421.1 Stress responsive A/B Barrel Domain [Mycobacteroides abscessus subsp. bolletii]SKH13120.1 Stress responsive A/B Barrel Domain [Mycobacteroides abscessus subsp. bolletii]